MLKEKSPLSVGRSYERCSYSGYRVEGIGNAKSRKEKVLAAVEEEIEQIGSGKSYSKKRLVQ